MDFSYSSGMGRKMYLVLKEFALSLDKEMREGEAGLLALG